jgi:hypothetical protein
MENMTLDILFFAMCLLTPFVIMFSIALHFAWRYLSHCPKNPVDDEDI